MGVRLGAVLLGMSAALVLDGCPQLSSDDFQEALGTTDPGVGGVNLGGAGAGSDPPDASAAQAPAVAALGAALAERYAFDGAGQEVIDSLSGARCWIYNSTLDGEGFVRLNGNNACVSLPNALLSSGRDRSIEVWLIWRGGAAGQRIFDFGTSDAGAFQQGSGTS